MSNKVDLGERMAVLGQELPGVVAGFAKLHKETAQDGVLSAKMKELIAVAVAVVVRCEHCIRFHIVAVVKLGASRKEILEVIGVAILMAGGPAVAYSSTVVLEILDELNVS